MIQLHNEVLVTLIISHRLTHAFSTIDQIIGVQLSFSSADNLSFTVRDGSGKEVCIFQKDELSNSFTVSEML